MVFLTTKAPAWPGEISKRAENRHPPGPRQPGKAELPGLSAEEIIIFVQ
jgi:hypothetical protein